MPEFDGRRLRHSSGGEGRGYPHPVCTGQRVRKLLISSMLIETYFAKERRKAATKLGNGRVREGDSPQRRGREWEADCWMGHPIGEAVGGASDDEAGKITDSPIFVSAKKRQALNQWRAAAKYA